MIKQEKQLLWVQELMRDFPHPWYVAGGWALDLALGEITREHEDMDICILREHAETVLQYFADWEIGVAIPGEQRLEACTSVADLAPPRYGLHLRREGAFLEILLTDRIGESIPYRRDPAITIPYQRFARVDAHGIPFVAPELQLLFKAKERREKDESDFVTHAPHLDLDAKKWLLAALQHHLPSSDWIAKLEKMIAHHDQEIRL